MGRSWPQLNRGAARGAAHQLAILSILTLLGLLLAIVVCIPWLLVVAMRGRKYGAVLWLAAFGVLVGHTVWQASMLPAPAGIDVALAATSASGDVSVHAIRMASPSKGHSVIEVDASNAGNEQRSLALVYYAKGGKIGPFYSPGASSGGMSKVIPPGWTGTLSFDFRVQHTFGYGGGVDIALGVLPFARERDMYYPLPGEAEEIFAEQFMLVPEKR